MSLDVQTKIKQLKTSRSYIKQRLTKISTYINTAMEKQRSIFEIKARLPNLEQIYTDYKQMHEGLLLSTNFSEESEEDYNEFEDLFYETKAKFDEIIHKITVVDTSGNNSITIEQPSQVKQNISIHLPKIHLHTFNGNYEKWIPFRDTFNSLINTNNNLSAVEKFHYLLSSLEGDPHKLVNKIELSATGYNQAWETLIERYDNKRVIVDKHINEILKLKTMKGESSTEIRKIIDETVNHLRALQLLGQPTEHWDMIIINIVSARLDSETRKQWELSINLNEFPNWQQMVEFLNRRARILEAIETTKQSSVIQTTKPKFTSNYTKPATSSASRNFVSSITSNSGNCNFCSSKTHYSSQCVKFQSLNPSERLAKVNQMGLCANCFRNNHKIEFCKSRTCKQCNRKHNTLLHSAFNNQSYRNDNSFNQIDQPDTSNRSLRQNISNNSINASHSSSNQTNGESSNQANSVDVVNNNRNSSSNSSIIAQPGNSSVNCSTADQQILLSTAVIFIRGNIGNFHQCRVLLDSASQSNFMTHDLVSKLGLKKHYKFVPVSGLNHMFTNINYKVATTIKSRINEYSAQLEFLVVLQITNQLPSNHFNINSWEIPSHIQLADPKFNEPSKIDALIGGELFYNLIIDGQVIISNEQITLQNSVLGYVVGGKINQRIHNFALSIANPYDQCDYELLHEQIKRFWEIESVETKPLYTKEETACEEHFIQNFNRLPDGRYSVRLPFRKTLAELGESQDIACKRFNYLESKLNRNSELKQQYQDFITEYLNLNHMQLVPATINPVLSVSNNPQTIQHFYLPHHSIIKPTSSTTKLRVVFDASAKTTSGLSLNDVLMVGPCIQEDLFSIIVRFRKHRYAFTGDIEKMYRQILVDKNDRIYQKILWRNEPSDSIQTFELNTITYGTSCAPYLATRVLKQLFIDESNNFPLAAERIDDFYMDDVMSGSDNLETAIQLQEQLTLLLKKGGMKLRKFSSNSQELLDRIPMQDRERKENPETNTAIKTLGLIWDTKNDKFLFNIKSAIKISSITKRIVLSQVAQIFDPLGLLAPIIVTAKIFIQRLWQIQLSWDDALPNQFSEYWMEFYNQLEAVKSIQLQRCIIPENTYRYELHGFADASEAAYGASLYIRCFYNGSKISVNLICSKSKVAPLKRLTIPRLELCAALLLTRLLNKVLKSIQLNFNHIFLWTDSTIVLAWIKTPASSLKTFVASRVAEIQELQSSIIWNHVDTHENPADIVSRGVMPRDLECNILWWSGPTYLQLPHSQWPRSQANLPVEEIPEIKIVKNTFATTDVNQNEFIQKYSSLSKLLRITSYCLRFIHNAKKPATIRNTQRNISSEELSNSLTCLVKLVQHETFANEINMLKQHRLINRDSRIKNLTPFLDSNNIIRVGGRIKNCSLSFDQKHQMLLPDKHHFTKLIIKNEHIKNLHCGAQALLNYVRFKFWPINGKRQSNQVIRQCIKCFKAKPVNMEQLMGNLPTERITPNRAFEVVGVDYCGPFLTKTQGIRSISLWKSYLAVFVCFTTKAIHIEVVSDLTTQCFLQALKRFIARRGKPSIINSDNGTNFIGAYNEIKKIRQFFQNSITHQEIMKFTATEEIKWRFIPPRAPHFGGLWEAGVKSVKHHLKRATYNHPLTFEEFYTLATQIEGCLNSRPITPLSKDPNDLLPLTPGHFLIGKPVTALPEPDVEHVNINRLDRWKKIEHITQNFWRRWSSEYLHTLQQRVKWNKIRNSLQENDLVIIHNENLPSTAWMMGRVLKLHTGDDGRVRVVSLKTQMGIIKRPITKLCPLPKDDNCSNHQ